MTIIGRASGAVGGICGVVSVGVNGDVVDVGMSGVAEARSVPFHGARPGLADRVVRVMRNNESVIAVVLLGD